MAYFILVDKKYKIEDIFELYYNYFLKIPRYNEIKKKITDFGASDL